MSARITSFYDPATQTISHIVDDEQACAIIDPVLDYDPKAGRVTTTSAQKLVDYIHQHQLKVSWILETHAHADHLSAAHWLKQQVGGKIAIGKHITSVQKTFKPIFNLEPEFAIDGSQFDYLFDDNEKFQIGRLAVQALHFPGHTPADLAYLVEDTPNNAVFVGDTIFMPDVGTARCDFPGGNTQTLYHSIQRLLSLPDDTRLYMCHDYPPENAPREPQWISSVAEQKRSNIHVKDGISEAEFVARRNTRDASLEMPVLLLPSIQVNVRAGHLPPPENNERRYLKIPLTVEADF